MMRQRHDSHARPPSAHGRPAPPAGRPSFDRVARPGQPGSVDEVLNIEQIVDWRGQDVFDRDGERLGKLDEVYYDRASGQALLGSIKSGLLGRHATLVPLDRASAGREYVRVAYPARQVKELNGVEIAHTLSADTLAQVRSIYGVRLDD